MNSSDKIDKITGDKSIRKIEQLEEEKESK
jgi:hypothetical protein